MYFTSRCTLCIFCFFLQLLNSSSFLFVPLFFWFPSLVLCSWFSFYVLCFLFRISRLSLIIILLLIDLWFFRASGRFPVFYLFHYLIYLILPTYSLGIFSPFVFHSEVPSYHFRLFLSSLIYLKFCNQLCSLYCNLQLCTHGNYRSYFWIFHWLGCSWSDFYPSRSRVLAIMITLRVTRSSLISFFPSEATVYSFCYLLLLSHLNNCSLQLPFLRVRLRHVRILGLNRPFLASYLSSH